MSSPTLIALKSRAMPRVGAAGILVGVVACAALLVGPYRPACAQVARPPASDPPAARSPAPVAPLAAQAMAARDVRYCEILGVRRNAGTLVASVYNTLGFNNCPPAQWDAITELDAERTLGVLVAILNGPRYFVMDRISSNASTPGEVVDVGGLRFRKQAEILLKGGQRGVQPYVEQRIDRATTYVFEAGKPVFELMAPGGARYVMQSYTTMLDRALTYADLPGLKSRLTLPAGWSYGTLTPDQDLIVGASGFATVVQDELKNTYQKLAD